jgi:hypothetical protein
MKKLSPSTQWYRENKNNTELREQYNARQRKWYHDNLERARELGRKHAKAYLKKNKKKAEASTERSRLKRGARNKAHIEAYKRSHPCIKCGEPDPIVLDFHHRNPKEKELRVSSMVWSHKIEAIDAEIAKCDVLCANCHRREHYRQEQNAKHRGKDGRHASSRK